LEALSGIGWIAVASAVGPPVATVVGATVGSVAGAMASCCFMLAVRANFGSRGQLSMTVGELVLIFLKTAIGTAVGCGKCHGVSRQRFCGSSCRACCVICSW